MIFQREFIKNFKSLLIWSIGLGGIVLLTMSIYPQFSENQQTLEQLTKAYPDSLKKALGMNDLSLGTILGFYGVEVYMMTTLFGSIYSAMLASNILAKEESEKTAEFLLSKPVTRTKIVTEKLAAVILNIILFNGVNILATVIGFQFADEKVDVKIFTLLALGTLLLHFTFAAISFFLSAIMKKTRNIISISIGLVFLAYFLQIISGLASKLDSAKFFSPFKYVDASGIISSESIDVVYLGIMAAVILLGVGGAFIVYNKKDISG